MSNQDPPKAVRVDSWSLEGGWPRHRSGVTIAGFLLIGLGLLLAAGQLFNEARIGASAFFLAVGALLIVVGFRDRSDLALWAGAFVTALALSDLLSSMSLIHGSGWGTMFLGLGVMGIAFVRSTGGKRLGWTLGIGALLALWGASDVAASNGNFPTDRLVGPLLIVLLGLYIVTRNRK